MSKGKWDRSTTYSGTPPRRDPAKMTALAQEKGCPKCGYKTGDDWGQCRGYCPIPGSPHFNEVTFKEQWSRAKLK